MSFIGAAIAGGGALLGGAMQASGAKKAAKAAEAAKGPWSGALPHINAILSGGKNWYENALQQGYIDPTGGVSQGYYDYLAQLGALAPNVQQGVGALLGQSMAGLGQAQGAIGSSQDVYNRLMSGEFALSPEKITEQAGKYIDSDLLQGAVDAATRDTARRLYEDELPAVDRAAIGAGSLGSSRAGVQAAITERAADERIGDISAQMRSSAYENALTRAMTGETQNVQQLMSGAQGGLNVAGQQMGLAGQQAGLAGNLPGIAMGGLSPMLEAAKTQQAINAQLAGAQIGERDYMLQLLQQYAGLVNPYTGFQNTGAGGAGMNQMNYGNLLQQLGGAAGSMYMQYNQPKTYSAGTGPYGTQFGNNPYQIIN